jgi:methylenetetrahydrofolate reductase (NADPH)
MAGASNAARSGADATTSAVAALMAGYSVEATARGASEVAALRDGLPPGAEVFIANLPHDAPDETVARAIELARAGLEPVPHIGVRYMESAAALDELIARLAAEAGVRRILLIAGDIDHPRGPFASTIDVLRLAPFARHGIDAVGIGAYPEGHPRIDDATLDAALRTKLDLLSAAEVSTFIVTQFCFEAAPIRRWIAATRQRGVSAPIRIGLAGPASLATLARYARRCGIGASARALVARPDTVSHLMRHPGPDPILRDLVAGGGPDPLPSGSRIHLFSFGGAERTVAWARKAAGG